MELYIGSLVSLSVLHRAITLVFLTLTQTQIWPASVLKLVTAASLSLSIHKRY